MGISGSSQVGLKTGVCTSTTRPSAPYAGQMVYETDTTRTVTWSGTAWVSVGERTVTSLPTSPLDGEIINYVADATNGVVWRLKYRAASASAYKWEFIGGSPLNSEFLAVWGSWEGTSSLYFTDLATVGPSFIVPLAGDYDCSFSVQVRSTTSSANVRVWVTGDSTSLDWTNGDSLHAASNPSYSTLNSTRRRTGVAAGATIKLQYAVSNVGVTEVFYNRRLRINPVRVG